MSQTKVKYEAFSNVATMPFARSDMVATTFPESLFKDNMGPRIYLTGYKMHLKLLLTISHRGCIQDQQCALNTTTVSLSCYCMNNYICICMHFITFISYRNNIIYISI